MDNENIKKEAKQIMDKFMNSLNSIQIEDDFVLIRDQCFRQEGEFKIQSNEDRKDFIELFLLNAKEISGSAIIANKGEWTKK